MEGMVEPFLSDEESHALYTPCHTPFLHCRGLSTTLLKYGFWITSEFYEAFSPERGSQSSDTQPGMQRKCFSSFHHPLGQ